MQVKNIRFIEKPRRGQVDEVEVEDEAKGNEQEKKKGGGLKRRTCRANSMEKMWSMRVNVA